MKTALFFREGESSAVALIVVIGPMPKEYEKTVSGERRLYTDIERAFKRLIRLIEGRDSLSYLRPIAELKISDAAHDFIV